MLEKIGIILNGVTGRMGTNQHLARSIMAIREQGGLKCGDRVLMPEPVLTGRNAEKLRGLAERYGVERYTTNLNEVLADPAYPVFFDASGTKYRLEFLKRAIDAGKAVYCEKPIADTYQKSQ